MIEFKWQVGIPPFPPIDKDLAIALVSCNPEFTWLLGIYFDSKPDWDVVVYAASLKDSNFVYIDHNIYKIGFLKKSLFNNQIDNALQNIKSRGGLDVALEKALAPTMSEIRRKGIQVIVTK